MTMRFATLVVSAMIFISKGDAADAPPSDPVAGRSHWAFQPFADLTETPVADWSQSRIDDFIAARLKQEGVKSVPDAGRKELIRRVYFQLVGLPPTAEQTQAFVENQHPDALEQVVDQLLGSPRFGERWGRHWLDLARYADSNGLDENFLFREAWRYRNWVIDAVNADVPFDRFVLEQIAGDALPYDSIEQRDRQRIAAGFMVIGPKVLLGNDANNQRMEVADEQIDTIGRSLLGLTLGCAKCHDHKFEPVPTADYYALAGILTSTQVMERRYMLGEQRVMERLVGLGQDGDALDSEYERYWRELPQARKKAERAKSALEFLKKDDAEGLKNLVEKNADALSDGAKDATQPSEQRIASQNQLIAELDAAIAQAPPIPPRAMIPSDVDKPADESIRKAGQFNQLGEKVPRGFLQVISTNNEIKIPDGKSGRLELGQWLTDVEHGAGRLTARVLANRIWHHMIGVGIVRTVDNFGRTGELPSHPELLDHLAKTLIDSGWSIKALVREIALSRSFALSSEYDAAAHEIDPDNRLMWRAHRRRLDPEALRDAMLMAAGQLDLSPMGSSVSYLGDQATAVGKNEVRRRTDFPNRSVYLPVIRNDLPELFEVFNFANPHATTGARPNITAATQGLFLLNDDMVMNAAEATAKQLLASPETSESRIDHMFRQILGLNPDDAERTELLDFVAKTESRLASEGDDNASLRAWSTACHALFSTSRFQFID
ncbi:MAG: DUF1549 domain-containing protein [Verrucomicrobiae bacterium]|nr:DUF1549 domain-containing protein [Verrucomicrobiae bacterium]